ncbi:MAG: exopolysaccharide biosynthesis protein [Alphaproteobacteria bacterium]
MNEHDERTSALLARLARNGDSERISIGMITDDLGDRGFGMLLCLWALPNLIPIPGISTPFGLLIVMTAGQMVLGRHRPWLPAVILARSFERSEFRRVIERARPHIEWLERYSRPRFEIMRRGLVERLLGLFIVVLGIALALPVWGGNFFPGIAVAIMGVGLFERDGIAVSAGVVVGILSLVIVASLIGTALYILVRIGQSLGINP